jgi:hypothetical protein
VSFLLVAGYAKRVQEGDLDFTRSIAAGPAPAAESAEQSAFMGSNIGSRGGNQGLRHTAVQHRPEFAVAWPVIEPHVGKILDAVDEAKPGTLTRVDCGTFSRRHPLPPRPGVG